jgi:hypothetical protein
MAVGLEGFGACGFLYRLIPALYRLPTVYIDSIMRRGTCLEVVLQQNQGI